MTTTRWRRFAMMGSALVLGFVSLLASAGEEPPAKPPPGEIRFVARNSIVKARGVFHSWRFSEINLAEGGLGVESAIVTVDLASVDTGIGRRDKHLRTADFFDVEQFPNATLRVYDIAVSNPEEGRYTAKLDIDLHGIQKTYGDFSFELVESQPLEVRGEFSLDRMDFGVGKPKSFNPMSIRNLIEISFSAKMPPSSDM